MTITIEQILPSKLTRRGFGKSLIAALAASSATITLDGDELMAMEVAAPKLTLELDLKPKADALMIDLYVLNHSSQALALFHMHGGSYVHEPTGQVRSGRVTRPVQIAQDASTLDRRAMMSRVLRVGHLSLPAMTGEQPQRILLGRYVAAWPELMIAHSRKFAGDRASFELSLDLQVQGPQGHVPVSAQGSFVMPSTLEARRLDQGDVEQEERYIKPVAPIIQKKS